MKEFKGVWIPAPVFLHPNLSSLQKLIWADIYSISMNKGRYFKTNQTIAMELNVGTASVTRAVKELQSMGLIESSEFNGRVRTLTINPNQFDEPASSKRLGRVIKTIKQTNQNDDSASSKRLTENTIENTNIDYQVKNKGDEVELPWQSERFEVAWKEWLKYRREAKLKTSPTSLRASLTKLLKLTGGDEMTAIEIINESIANGWKGFFPLKNQNHGKRSFTADGLSEFITQG